ncbi:helix-turn-helix domain-containing protein [Micromonospora sp. C28SCA-DRY-2]|uniref:helix-turn-helix domain-containing protein n=1 Tax=Micromonospora sp. C28SCA-DRY-2 TaxID=3059522 RepID=UPI002674E27C|nr:transcriptional regulator [Micromonospora sp. C28SCA-DRY-2]MDO3701413.1 helix-turn-helix domain-containing protein [Micromonospora sp. C28SCA-DRY-2]
MSLLRRVIGGVLRRLRLRQGRTLREVAVAAGVSVPYLSEIERGRKEASSEVLAAICRALGIRLSDLLEEARDDLRRVEPRIPTAPRAALARLERVPVSRHEESAPRLTVAPRAGRTRVGFGPGAGEPRPHLAERPHTGGSVLLTVGVPAYVGNQLPVLGSTVGGAGLRVRLIPSAPAGRPRPRTAKVLARRRGRAGRRRLTPA